MRTITILAHAGVVTGFAGLFFGLLAWINNSPYGLPMSGGSTTVLVLSGALGWYYGFSPMWQPYGWEERVEHGPDVDDVGGLRLEETIQSRAQRETHVVGDPTDSGGVVARVERKASDLDPVDRFLLTFQLLFELLDGAP